MDTTVEQISNKAVAPGRALGHDASQNARTPGDHALQIQQHFKQFNEAYQVAKQVHNLGRMNRAVTISSAEEAMEVAREQREKISMADVMRAAGVVGMPSDVVQMLGE